MTDLCPSASTPARRSARPGSPVVSGGTLGDATAARPRSQRDLAAAQLLAVARFHEALRAAERAAAAAARSRELRMDAARTMEVLRREHAAIIARADEQLRLSCQLLARSPARRVVLAHRGAWFADKVGQLLVEQGWQVLATLDNGADAVGVAVAEQADALLVEDTLAMLPGEQVVREVRALCPGVVVLAQASGADRVGALLEAGATSVVSRRLPPAEVARGLQELVPS